MYHYVSLLYLCDTYYINLELKKGFFWSRWVAAVLSEGGGGSGGLTAVTPKQACIVHISCYTGFDFNLLSSFYTSHLKWWIKKLC